MAVKKMNTWMTHFVGLLLILYGYVSSGEVLKCSKVLSQRTFDRIAMLNSDKVREVTSRTPILELSSAKGVYIEKLSTEPELLNLPNNSSLFQYGIDPNIDVTLLKVGSTIPYMDGRVGSIVKRGEEFWSRREFIEVVGSSGNTQRMHLSQPLKHWGRRYKLHVTRNGNVQKIEIWDASTNANRPNTLLVDRIGKIVSSLSQVELETLEFIRINPFLDPVGLNASGSATFVHRWSRKPSEIDLYGNVHSFSDDFVTYVLSHEIGHNFALREFGTFKPPQEWKKAMKLEQKSVSEYAKTSIEEDFAESFEAYFSRPDWFKENFPLRHRLLDKYVKIVEGRSAQKKIPKQQETKDKFSSGAIAPKPMVEPIVATQTKYLSDLYKSPEGSSISFLTATSRGQDNREPRPKYEYNEDAIGIVPVFNQAYRETGFSVIVADGMGGHGSGDVASQVAVNTYVRLFKQGYSTEQIIPLIPNEIYRKYKENEALSLGTSAQMGATLVVANIENGWLTLSHVGDSRAVVFRDGQVLHKTKDDSYVAQLGLSEEQAMAHPENNRVLKALMIQDGRPGPAYQPTQSKIQLHKNDLIVMASDGMWDFVSSAEVNAVITKLQEPEKIKQALMKMIADRSGDDNITIAVIRYGS